MIQATVEATVQPTVEHTVEATVQPTVELTVEPTVGATVEPVEKKQRAVNFHDQVVKTQGQTLTCPIPNGQVMIQTTQLTILENNAEVLCNLRKQLQGIRYYGGSECGNIITVAGLAGSATIPFRTFSETISIIMLGLHLFDSGICSGNKFDLEKYVKSFPCDKFLRQRVYKVAAMCTMSISVFFTGKPVFLASDKGMIHMVNMCYTWSNVVPKSFIFLLLFCL